MTYTQGHQLLSGTVRLFIPWPSEQPWLMEGVPDGANQRVCREVGRSKCQGLRLEMLSGPLEVV